MSMEDDKSTDILVSRFFFRISREYKKISKYIQINTKFPFISIIIVLVVRVLQNIP